MRICLVSQEYPTETAKGGLSTQTYLKAHGLAALGHAVHVISASATGQPTEQQDGPVSVTRVGSFHNRLPLYTSAAHWVTHSSEVAAAVWQLHRQQAIDVVDFPEWGAEGFTHLINRTEWNHIPTVLHLHGPLVMLAHTINWPDRDSEFYRVGTFMEATCLRLADALFSSSACTIDWCARHYGVNPADIPVLHTGVDIQRFTPAAASKEQRPTIIFAGRIAENKGVMYLMEAVARLVPRFPDLQVWMLGRGDEKYLAELQARITSLGVTGNVRFIGYVSRHDLPAYLARAHVFAGPSCFEAGPGVVYLEAMACGLPVVAGNQGGAPEVLIPGENGLLVPPRDAGALTAALEQLLADPVRCQRMSRQARAYVEANADSRQCLRRLEEFYQKVVARFGSRR